MASTWNEGDGGPSNTPQEQLKGKNVIFIFSPLKTQKFRFFGGGNAPIATAL